MKKSFKKFLLLVLSSFLTFIFLFEILLPISSIAAFAGGSSTNKSEIKAKKEGYLLVFDANTTVISADRIHISNIVVERLNKSLPKISVEKKKEKKVD